MPFACLRARCVTHPCGPSARVEELTGSRTSTKKITHPGAFDFTALLRAVGEVDVVPVGALRHERVEARPSLQEGVEPPLHGVPVVSRSISPPWRVNSISSGSPHVRPMGRTCGEPDEIKKNTRPKNIATLFRDRVLAVGEPEPGVVLAVHRELVLAVRWVGELGLRTETGGNVFRVGIFLGFVRRSGTTRTEGPHGAHVRRAKRNRIGPHRGGS